MGCTQNDGGFGACRTGRMTQPVRHVVTGHDPDGRAVFASDSMVEPVTTAVLADTAFHLLWGGDGPPHFPDDGARPPVTTYFPPVGGYRLGSSRCRRPTSRLRARRRHPGALADLGAVLPGLLDHMEPDNPGMHTTSTVDFEVVLAGEVVLQLDNGATRPSPSGRHGRPERHPAPVVEPRATSRPRSRCSSCGAHHDRVHRRPGVIRSRRGRSGTRTLVAQRANDG